MDDELMESDNNPKIRNFWQSRAADKTLSSSEVTHKDIWQRWLEIETIKRYLKSGDRVLDAGCGNCYTTREISSSVREIIGIDSSPEMIKRALEEKKTEGIESINFAVLDVLELDQSKFGLFNVVISERCLINLDSWEKQQRAIANLASVISPGGRLIFVEGCKDGRTSLNEFRAKVGLEPMPPVWHNLDFDKVETLAYLGNFFDIEEQITFGVYDFISRVLHPLLVSPQQPQYDSRINEVAARLSLNSQEYGEISRILFLVLKKR